MVCDLLVVERRHIDFKLIFNYRPEHFFWNRYVSIDYTYNRPINELFNVGLPTRNKIRKRIPIIRDLFMVLLNQVFPCLYCFSKNHSLIYFEMNKGIFVVDRDNGMLLNCHMWQFFFSGYMAIKNTLILEKRVFTYKKLVYEEFLIYI